MSEKKRLFVAIDLPQEVKQNIFAKLEPYFTKTDAVKWVEAKNYHFTLKFLGNIEPEKIEKIKTNLRATAEKTHPFDVYLGKFDLLPENEPARIVYLQVAGGEEAMGTTAFEVEEALATIGVDKEKRQYLAHLTVGRISKPKELAEFPKEIQSIAGLNTSIKVNEFILFESKLDFAGPSYEVIEKFTFGAMA